MNEIWISKKMYLKFRIWFESVETEMLYSRALQK